MWERPPANNFPQTPHSAGAYGTGYFLFKVDYPLELDVYEFCSDELKHTPSSSAGGSLLTVQHGLASLIFAVLI
jgi:hypothetical protein